MKHNIQSRRMADEYENLSREDLIAQIRRLQEERDRNTQQVESALRESEERFRNVMENAPIGMTLTALDGHYLQINRAFCRFLGYEKDELYKLSFKDISHPDELPADLAAGQRLQAGEIDTYRREKRYIRKDGRTVWGQLTVSLFRDDRGTPLYYIAQLADINDSKQAEEALRQSEEKFRTLVANLPQKIFVKNVDSIYVSCNALYAQDLGIAAAEIEGKTDYDFYPPDLAEKYRGDDKSVMTRGEVQELEERYLQDGQERIVNTIKAPVRNEQGRVVGVVGVFWDITERKRTEHALWESEKRFRTMADTVPSIIWMAEADGEGNYLGCTFFNKGWHDFTGLSLDQTPDSTWLGLVHPDDRERCLATYTDAFREKRPFKQAYRLRRHDGKYRWMQDSGIPRFTEDGAFLGHIGTCVDITRHVQIKADRAQQQLAMDRSTRFNIAGEMASGLTHELSQPVTATLNYLDACLRRLDSGDYDPDKQRQCLNLALTQTQRAGSIINNFKTLIHKSPSPRMTVDLNRLLQDTPNLLEYEIEQQHIDLTFDLEPLPLVIGNQVEIQQVLLNLMKNAVEAMQDSPQRKLQLISRPLEKQRIRVEIRDSGKGISHTDLDLIFHPFHTTKKGGLGLGLAICRTLVESHGGRIWASSIPGGGTCFSIVLPAEGVS